ncbi:hypothetical protein ACYZTX_29575 [Pseudomonas sp. MDT1-17]
MTNKNLIVTTCDFTDIPVIMAPPGHGASFINPKLFSCLGTPAVTDVMAEPRKRGYTKPKAWPSK